MSIETLGGGAFLVALAGLLAWFLGRRSGKASAQDLADLERQAAVLHERDRAAVKIEEAARAEGQAAKDAAEIARAEREAIAEKRARLAHKMAARAKKWGGG